MRYYPIHLDLQGRRVVVVGAGSVAAGKIAQLLDAGAVVTVVAPQIAAEVRELEASAKLEIRERQFERSDLSDALLVIGATNDRETNCLVSEAACELGVLCNIVDEPDLCDFITPALVIRGDLQIGISTSGGSPTLAQRVKREIASLIGDEYGELLQLAAEMRQEAKRLVPDFEGRRDLLRAFVESDALELIREGRIDAARQLARSYLRGSHVNGTQSDVGSGNQSGSSEPRGQFGRDDSRMGGGRVW